MFQKKTGRLCTTAYPDRCLKWESIASMRPLFLQGYRSSPSHHIPTKIKIYLFRPCIFTKVKIIHTKSQVIKFTAYVSGLFTASTVDEKSGAARQDEIKIQFWSGDLLSTNKGISIQQDLSFTDVHPSSFFLAVEK